MWNTYRSWLVLDKHRNLLRLIPLLTLFLFSQTSVGTKIMRTTAAFFVYHVKTCTNCDSPLLALGWFKSSYYCWVILLTYPMETISILDIHNLAFSMTFTVDFYTLQDTAHSFHGESVTAVSVKQLLLFNNVFIKHISCSTWKMWSNPSFTHLLANILTHCV